jgi:hypothetical protein
MKFECGDLDRALAMAELMPEAREHLKQCAACRREYRVWTEISGAAKQLHQEWESPELWGRIRETIEAQRRPTAAWWKDWKTWAAAAAVVLIAVGFALLRAWDRSANTTSPAAAKGFAALNSGNRELLTEQALKEVESTEAAYRQSIQKLSHIAQPKLEHPVSAVEVNCREKLVMLDSAIAETRANLDQNRFNVQLQTALANLYREKQETLKELLTRDQKN